MKTSWIIMQVVILLILGLSSVGVNIERLDKAYDIRKMEKELARKTALSSKFEVERNNLLSPYRLKQLAASHGLDVAEPGSIRKLQTPGQ